MLRGRMVGPTLWEDGDTGVIHEPMVPGEGAGARPAQAPACAAASSQRSVSIAAMQPDPAAVMA